MIASFHHILIPLDGSRLAEAILPPAMTIAASTNAGLTLLHVIEHDAPSSVHGEQHLDSVAEATAYLEQISGRCQDAGIDIDVHVHPNEEHDVPRSIAEHAAELGVDLIALATHGSGGIRGFVYGNVAQRVLRRTTTPVLLVHPNGVVRVPLAERVILVPLDGGFDAEAALPYAELLANSMHSALRLVRVVPTITTVRGSATASATFSPGATAGMLDLEAQQARDYLAEVAIRLPDQLDVSGEVVRGAVADGLVDAARRLNVDLLVMSTHARSGIEGFLTGSIGAALLGRLHRPLLLIPMHASSAIGDE